MRPFIQFPIRFRSIKRKRFQLLDKRQRFAIQTVLLTAGILTTQLIWEEYRFLMVFILAALSYILTIWSLREDIRGTEWLHLFILPVAFTASVSLFYFLLPGRWITRLTIGTVFAVGTYAILLVENIYNVAAIRSIQLLRAGRSVGLLLTLIIIFLSASIVYSLRLWFWQNMLILSAISFVLALQSVWSARLDVGKMKELSLYAAFIAWGIGQLALALSFWPISNASYSLLMTAAYYSMVSIIQQHLLERLFKDTIREYVFVFIFTLFLALITTRWS